MTSYRADQVGEQVREEIMSIIRRELKDPRIGFVSITGVRMSPDLRQARVRVSVLGNPEQLQHAGHRCGKQRRAHDREHHAADRRPGSGRSDPTFRRQEQQHRAERRRHYPG